MNKLRILVIIKVLLYAFLGLAVLLAEGLPPLEDTTMLEILPQLFPLLAAAFSLFLLPLLKQSFYFYVLLAFDSLVAVLAFVLLWQGEAAPAGGLLALGATALLAMAGTWYFFYRASSPE